MAEVPIYRTLGFANVEFQRGSCRAVVPREPDYDGIFHTFHGGLLMTVVDLLAALAVLTLTGANTRITTTSMGIRFLAPARGAIAAQAHVVRLGRTLVPLSVELRSVDQELLAVADVTYLRLGFAR
jgi:uncharacterized protein (TIGR00369 family)